MWIHKDTTWPNSVEAGNLVIAASARFPCSFRLDYVNYDEEITDVVPIGFRSPLRVRRIGRSMPLNDSTCFPDKIVFRHLSLQV